MKRNYIFTLLTALLISFFGVAQEKKLEKANKSYERYAYIDAQKIFLRVAQEGFRSADLFQKLGNSYYFNADYDNAVKWYGELMASYTNEVEPEYYFRYAQSLKAAEQYDESDKWMSKFFTFKGGDARAKTYQDKPEYLRAIDFQSGRYKIKNLVANSEYSDFGPTYYGEELVFASARDTGVFAKRIHEWNNKPFLELFVGDIKPKSGEVVGLEKFNNRLNTKFHESTPVFTKDLKTMYFTRNNYNNGVYREAEDGTNKLKIYKSTLSDDGTWSKAESIRFNSDEYAVAHPALSPDNKKLYFSSDMPGGVGSSDLYEADINDDGTLGDPRNLGPEINTEGRETFPFISESGDMYFASNGHIGLGGLDLYVTKLDAAGNVGAIINLGEPANSPKDDFAFIVNESTKRGYFSSNRNGGRGDDDIYKFIQLEDVKEDCEIVLTGVVTDKDSEEVLAESTVTLFDENNTLVKSMVVGPRANYAFVVECGKTYFLRADKDDYNTVEELITTPSVSETMDVPLELEKTIKKATIGEDLGKILSLNPIYFDFDKYNIRYDASVELAKVIQVMLEYPTMKIDVRSHTDSRGNDSYNMALSDNRAKSTVKYIISKGIDGSRLSGKGYGETQLTNDCANGVPCSVQKHQLNRRSEFIILEY